MMTARPPNLQLLEDFQGGLDSDGVHFQIMDGVNFAHSLVDQVVTCNQACPGDFYQVKQVDVANCGSGSISFPFVFFNSIHAGVDVT